MDGSGLSPLVLKSAVYLGSHLSFRESQEALALQGVSVSVGQCEQKHHSHAYQAELSAWGMKPSFTGTGACLDNAFIESFWATLKKELVHQTTFASREEARAAIFEFIEVFYNRSRLHSSLGYKSPTTFEALASSSQLLAA
jgi:transposase InsO family protein